MVFSPSLCQKIRFYLGPIMVHVLVTQSCMTLWDSMVFSPPGSSVHGIFQARLLEWVAIAFSRGSFQPRDHTHVSCIAGRFFTVWTTIFTIIYTFAWLISLWYYAARSLINSLFWLSLLFDCQVRSTGPSR